MATEKITIAELDIDVDALLKSTSEVKKSIDDLKKVQLDLAKQGDTNSKQYVQNAADLKTLNSAYNSNIKAISDSTNAQADSANRTQLVSLALQSEVTSIKEAREQNSLLNKLRNETNVTTEEGKAELTALNKKLDENNDFIKENADQYLKQKINIGNYSESIKEAVNNLNPLNGGLTGFIERSKSAGGVGNLLSTSFAAITQGIIGMTRASLAFLATPIGAIIGAIALALGSLYKYLTSTKSGIDAITAVTRPLEAVMSALGTVVSKVGKFLFEAFTSPKKVMVDLYEFVKQNLINRFTAFGEILEGILTLDFKKVTNGVLQAGTGVENLTDKIANGAKETGKFLDDAIKKGQEIDRLKKQIEESELSYQKAQIKTQDQLDELELTVKNTSLSFKERAAAAEEQIRLTEELSLKEQQIVKDKIKSLELEYSLKDAKDLTIEEQQKMIDLQKQLDDAEDRGIDARIEKSKVLSGLQKEQQSQAEEAAKKAAEARQKALDDALAKTEAELKLFLSSQGTKAKSLEEGLKIAEVSYQKELEIAQRAYDASKHTEVDKLNFQIAQIDAKNKLLDEQAKLVVENGQQELANFIEVNKSKLDAQKFLTDASVQQEKDRLDAIAKEQADFAQLELDNGVKNQKQYNEAINAINAENKQKQADLDAQKKQADADAQAIDLENKRATEDILFKENYQIQQQRLEEERQLELANADKTGANKNLIEKKYDALAKALRDKNRDAELEITAAFFGQIRGFLKDNTTASKALAVAEATINTYLGATKALATLPPPYSYIQAGITIATGLKNVGTIADIKFEQGGTMLVGGNRHSEGGTKFVGSDGTRFEAEKGELIGVLNRGASSQFMAFNDAFGQRGQIGTSYAATGGIIARGMSNNPLDIEQFASLTAQAVSFLPPPVVSVEDINRGRNQVAVIENGANF